MSEEFTLPVALPKPHLDARLLGAHRIFVFTDDALFDAVGVRIAFTGRAGGVSKPPLDELNLGINVNDDPASIAENRARLLEALGAPGIPLVVPLQVHGTNAVVVEGPDDAARAQAIAAEGADLIVVAVPGVAAQLSFADCLPLIIVSPTGRFAVAHAGWRGAVAGVAGKAVAALAQADREAGEVGNPATFNAYIGPYIHAACFETGAEVIAAFVDRYGDDVLVNGCVSLARAVTADMRAEGFDPVRIADVQICTTCSTETFFSHRASGGSCGRHGAIAFACERGRS